MGEKSPNHCTGMVLAIMRMEIIVKIVYRKHLGFVGGALFEVFKAENHGIVGIWENEVDDPHIVLGIWGLGCLESPSATFSRQAKVSGHTV